jgi:cytochrome d ubiquinol oxidase subunit II
MFPFILPSSTVPNSSLTVWDAPSSHLTLMVMFWAAAIFVPLILLYTFWSYRALWGKVTVKQIQEKRQCGTSLGYWVRCWRWHWALSMSCGWKQN